jgi:hypothetical protein
MGLYLYANQEALNKRCAFDSLKECGMLTTESELILKQEADPEVKKAF